VIVATYKPSVNFPSRNVPDNGPKMSWDVLDGGHVSWGARRRAHACGAAIHLT
jgi:hypothetical protein